MKPSKFCRAVLFGVGAFFGATAQAAVVQVTADGNSYTDFDFWSVSFTTTGSETVSLSSIRIDLGPLSADAYFDFDGIFSLACPDTSCVPSSSPFVADRSGEGPIFNNGVGVVSGDVDFNYDPLTDPERPTSLNITFTDFIGGDSFTFGANTNGLTEEVDFNTGDLLAGAQLTAFFSDGSSASGLFANTCGPQCSLAVVESAVVPVPAAVWLFGSGLLGLVAVARRRR